MIDVERGAKLLAAATAYAAAAKTASVGADAARAMGPPFGEVLADRLDTEARRASNEGLVCAVGALMAFLGVEPSEDDGQEDDQ